MLMLDLEEELINHLQDQDSLEYVLREGMSSSLLLKPKTRSIYNFVQHHFNTTGKIPTLKVLEHEYPDITFGKPDTTIEYVVDKLKFRYQKNEVQALTERLAEAVHDPDAAIQILRQEVFRIEQNSLSQANIYKPGDHLLFIQTLQEQVLNNAFKGASVGFREIDKFTGGIKNGNVCYILARPKRKKSWFMLNAFIEQAIEGRKPYFFTLELMRDEVMLRLACMLSGVSWNDAQQGALMPADYKKMTKALAEFDQYEWWLEQPNLDERTLPSLLLKADKVGAESVFISQFRYIKGLKDFYRSEHEEHAEIAIDLKRAASRPGSERPFVIEAQFNRGGDSMEDLEDFTGSKVGLTDMIPQSADMLYGLFENKDLRANGLTQFGVLDARNHDKASWTIKSDFVKQTEFKFNARLP